MHNFLSLWDCIQRGFLILLKLFYIYCTHVVRGEYNLSLYLDFKLRNDKDRSYFEMTTIGSKLFFFLHLTLPNYDKNFDSNFYRGSLRTVIFPMWRHIWNSEEWHFKDCVGDHWTRELVQSIKIWMIRKCKKLLLQN